MAYGTARVKNIIWNSGGGDTVFDWTSGLQNGDNYSGGVLQGNSITGITGVFTTSISGVLIQGTYLNTDTLSGVSGIFTAFLSGDVITGESVNVTSVTGVDVSGITIYAQTGVIGELTASSTISASSFSATTADIDVSNAVNARFTTELSGAAITGGSLNTTAITGGDVSGTALSGSTASIDVLRTTGTIAASTFTATTGDLGTVTATSGTYTVISGGDYKASGDVTVISSAGAVIPFGLFSFPGNIGTSGATLISKGNGTTQWNAGSSNYNVEVVTGTITGTAGTTYVMTSGTTFTLPATPATGDFLILINRSETTTGTVDRNGSNIMGLAEDLEINDLVFKTEFIFYGDTEGWVLL